MNGHATLNGEKMSKSTGNFLTLDAALGKFGADATRIGLADAGDSVEDANFEETVANAIILKLYELRKWIEEQAQEPRFLQESETYAEVKEKEKLKSADVIQRRGRKIFWDELFENELATLTADTIHSYEQTSYKAALKTGFYDLTAARDQYRTATSAAGIGMNHDCILKYIELQAQLLAPLAPHWSEYIFSEVLQKASPNRPSVANI
jgi:leucyl-tRNA synthetase